MRARFWLVGLIVIGAVLPATLFGQIGVGGRIGTLGVGPDISLGIGDQLAVRGSVGFLPVAYTGTYSDIDYTVSPPATIWSAGIDLYPGLGSLRLSAGFLHRPRYELAAQRVGSATIGNQTYSGAIELTGYVRNAKETAPFASIGFGRTTARGIGLFMDLGAAFVGDADIELSGTCTLSSGQPCPGDFQAAVEQEEAQAEADFGKFLRLHPIFQIGMSVGF